MRKVLMLFCVAVALGCFLYVGIWLVNGFLQTQEDTQLAQLFHGLPEPVEEAETPVRTDGNDIIAAQADGELIDPTWVDEEDIASVQTDEEDIAPTQTDEYVNISIATESATPAKTASPSSEETVSAVVIDERFEQLIKINPDVVGWISIEDTAIDYPVVRGEDNELYLTTDFQGEYSKRGSIFMDYRCSEDSSNTIIYGHRMKDGSMFHDLSQYQNANFLKEHSYIRYYTLYGVDETYRVVDVLYWDAAKQNDTTFYEYMTGLNYGEGKLIFLTTCDSVSRDARVVVIAYSPHD